MERLRSIASWMTTGVVTAGAAAAIVIPSMVTAASVHRTGVVTANTLGVAKSEAIRDPAKHRASATSVTPARHASVGPKYERPNTIPETPVTVMTQSTATSTTTSPSTVTSTTVGSTKFPPRAPTTTTTVPASTTTGPATMTSPPVVVASPLPDLTTTVDRGED